VFCLLLQNDITANWRYTALKQNLLLFFFKILSHVCTHNYTIHFTRCFAPVRLLIVQQENKGQSTLTVSQQDQVQSEIKFARYPPTPSYAMMHVLISLMQKAVLPAWKSISLQDFTDLCWRTFYRFLLQKHDPSQNSLMFLFYFTLNVCLNTDVPIPAEETSAQDYSCCQRLSMTIVILKHLKACVSLLQNKILSRKMLIIAKKE